MAEISIENADIPSVTIGDPGDATTPGNVHISEHATYPSIVVRSQATDKTRLLTDLNNDLSFLDVTSGLFVRKYPTLASLLELNTNGVLSLISTASAPGSPVAGQIFLWANSSDEASVMDGSGNVTVYSPHNFDGVTLDPGDDYPVAIRHENRYLGKRQWLYLSKMARLIEDMTGEQLLYDETIAKANWQQDENLAQARRATKIAAYDAAKEEADKLPAKARDKVLKALGDRPKPYTPRPEPSWIAARKNRP